MSLHYTVIDDRVIPAALAAMYAIAGYVRWKAARINIELRRVYMFSLPLAVFFCGTNIWLAIYGDGEPRREISRAVNLVALPVIWIIPAVESLRLGMVRRRAQAEMEELLRMKSNADRRGQ